MKENCNMPVCARIESVVIKVMFCVLHTIQREKNNNKGVRETGKKVVHFIKEKGVNTQKITFCIISGKVDITGKSI